MTDTGARVLVVDDNQAIHDDIRKVLCAGGSRDAELQALEAELFGRAPATSTRYRVDGALQGEAGLRAVQGALADDDPFAVAFVDVRMPPGWDGIETIARMWRVDPHLQVVICTAYSDHSWTQIVERLGSTDNLLVLKKPFDSIELLQMANALARKWALQRDDREKLRHANEELRRSNALLEDKSSSLERAIAELHAAQASLVRAGRMAAVGQLAAGLAHEINNPLTVILGFAEGMQRRIDGEHAFAMPVTAIARETVRCRDLVRRLGTFARAATRPGDTAEMRDVVAMLVELVEPRARTQDVRLTVHLEPGIGLVHGHAAQLEQVLVDMVNNALDAMPQGGELEVAVRSSTEGVRLEIRDSGHGIAADDLPRVFDPFFTTKEVGKGTGLGLSIAHEVVQQAGGTIDISSRIGIGTTVTITLPRSG
jgi:two-component system, NtrC family, sensor kinase